MLKSQWLFSSVLLVAMLSGCAGTHEPGNAIYMRMDEQPSPSARLQKYPVLVRLVAYEDARDVSDPRLIGQATTRVLGMTGKNIMLDSEVAKVVAASMKKRLSDDGLQFVEDDKAQFQLGGVVKTLSVDIKERDYLNIVIESTLTETASGRVIWSGVVAERKERYAGVMGDSKGDVAAFLKSGLKTISHKTSESILSVLMATRPELFGVAGVAVAAPGVTVYADTPVPVVAPGAIVKRVAATGKLALTSEPDNVKVYVDDVYYGLTPLEAEMPSGIYQLRFELDGYAKSSEKVSVRLGDRTELKVKLHH
ncbi:MAG: PEGA domain-containing protein [Gammaproteobacteria bacterium]|nr:PEGA domain-containing protein [Gammaproteobacteria bacterium]MBU1625551.1 PEGA domain-containing protein [Gammaproteobacteria bacterium]MBU1980811.1 PEGA domain-containing protein [Gammaproteobacteria bacterium]